MKPELLEGLALAAAVATSYLVAALLLGAGAVLAFLIYSLSGAASLMAGSLSVTYHQDIRMRRGRSIKRPALVRSWRLERGVAEAGGRQAGSQTTTPEPTAAAARPTGPAAPDTKTASGRWPSAV